MIFQRTLTLPDCDNNAGIWRPETSSSALPEMYNHSYSLTVDSEIRTWMSAVGKDTKLLSNGLLPSG